MREFLLLLPFIIPVLSGKAQSLYFPPSSGNTWETISHATLGWCTDQIPQLYDYLESTHTKAFIILKDGRIVIERYFDTFTSDSIWYWASAGKTLTSFMVGIAQQEGHLSIQDTTSDYLGQGWTSCSPKHENKITIRHQLTMTTGLDEGVPDNYCTLDSCLLCLADAGTQWAYHNAPYTLLDQVIEQATGVSLNSYINLKLKIPTGITGGFFPSGYNNVFFSKPRSMARFGLLVLNHGNWNGNQIMTDTDYFDQMISTSQSLNLSYGYLWWLNGKPSFRLPGVQFEFPGPLFPNAPQDMFAALGKNGQLINIVPSQNLVLIRMGNVPGEGEVSVRYNDTIWQKLNQIICGVNSSEDIRNVPEPGVYPNPADKSLTIDLHENSADIVIMDLSGHMVYHHAHGKGLSVVHCNEVPEGIYFLLIKSAANTFIRKLIVQHE